jgi:opacity protein-like surface antigen
VASISRESFRVALLLGALLFGAQALSQQARDADREHTFETTLHANFYETQTLGFEHGSQIKIDSTTGWGFFWGYNFTNLLSAGLDMSWAQPNAKLTIQPAQTGLNARSLSGEFNTFSLTAIGTWNVLPGPLTPYFSGGIGWTSINTNIPTGQPVPGCWWDPWWGYVCDYYYPTAYADKVSYIGTAGLRWDTTRNFFMRASWNRQYIDMRGGHPTLDSWRAELGLKF